MDASKSFYKVILFYEKCRLCLDKPGVRNMFQKDSSDAKKSFDLPHAILSFTGVKVSPKDNLPQKICEVCLEIISKAEELKLQAKKNDTHLRSLFNTASDAEDDEISDSSVGRLIICSNSETEPVQSSDIESKHRSKKRSNDKTSSTKSSKKRRNISQCESTQEKKISIRKDLYEPSASVSSSTKVKTKDDTNIPPYNRHHLKDGTTEFECGICSKRYETWKKLYLHQRMHNKTIACPLDACGKKFATRGDLEKHIRTHTGVKPFVCDICDKGFAQQGTLKSHREAVHRDFKL